MAGRMMQCGICGKLVVPNPTLICSDCYDIDAQLFDKTKKVLNLGEKVNLEELSDRSGVDPEHIKRWVRTGRLEGVV